MGGWGSWAPVTAESSARPPPLVTLGSPAPTPYGPREHKALPAGSLERHWFGDRPLAHYAAAPHPLVGFPLPKRGAGGPGRPLDPPLRVRPLLIWSPRDTRRGWGAGPGAGGLPARPFSVPTPPRPRGPEVRAGLPGALLAGAPTLHRRDAGRVPARGLLARGGWLRAGLGLGPRPRAPLLLLLVGASGRKAVLDKGTARALKELWVLSTGQFSNFTHPSIHIDSFSKPNTFN